MTMKQYKYSKTTLFDKKTGNVIHERQGGISLCAMDALSRLSGGNIITMVTVVKED